MWAGPLLSGLGHAAAIALAIETLPWLRAHDEPPPAVVTVTLLTPADLAARTAPPPPAPEAPAAAPVPAAPLPPPSGAPAPAPAATVPAPADPEPDPAEETLAPAFDAAAPLGLAAADDPATTARAVDLAPEPQGAPRPVLAAPEPPAAPPPPAAVRPRPRIALLPPPSSAVSPPLLAAPPAAASAATEQPAGPRAPLAGPPPEVLGPVFVDGPAAEPTLRPNLPPAPGADISTYVPPLEPRTIPGDSPALRRPPTGAEEAAASAYEKAIRDAVAAARSYPPEALTRGVEGTAGLKVIVRRDGRLVTAILLRSSGSSTLDRAALEAARRAIFPAAPTSLPGDRFAADATLTFRLDAPRLDAPDGTVPQDVPAALPPDGG